MTIFISASILLGGSKLASLQGTSLMGTPIELTFTERVRYVARIGTSLNVWDVPKGEAPAWLQSAVTVSARASSRDLLKLLLIMTDVRERATNRGIIGDAERYAVRDRLYGAMLLVIASASRDKTTGSDYDLAEADRLLMSFFGSIPFEPATNTLRISDVMRPIAPNIGPLPDRQWLIYCFDKEFLAKNRDLHETYGSGPYPFAGKVSLILPQQRDVRDQHRASFFPC